MEFDRASIKNSTDVVSLLLIAGILILPFPSLSIGPIVLRQLDFFVIIVGIYIVFREPIIAFPRSAIAIILPLAGLFIYATLLLLFQPFSVTESLVELVEILELIVAIIVFYKLFELTSENIVENVLFLVFFTTVIGSIVAIPYYFVTNDRFVGSLFIIGIPYIGIYYGISEYIRSRRSFIMIGTLLILIRVILAQTRSVWLILPTAGLFTIVVMHNEGLNWRYFKRISSMIFGGTILTVSTIILSPAILNRIQSLVSGSQGLFARPVRYYSGLQVLEHHPLGVGLANYGAAVQQATIDGILVFPEWFTNITGDWIVERQLEKFAIGKGGPHSDLFKLLVEAGVIGLILFVTVWMAIFRMLLTGVSYEYRTAIQASIVYIGFNSMVNSVLLSGGGILLALLISIDLAHSTHADSS